jgi:DNA-binding NtrC family response regulator
MTDINDSPPAELLSLLDARPEPRILIDRAYRIVGANQAYRDAYGAGRAVLGRTCHQVSHRSARPCDDAGEACPLKNCAASGQGQRVLHVHHTPRGEEHVSIELLPVRDAGGAVRYFLETLSTLKHASANPLRPGMIGRSEAFRRVLALIERAAPSDTTVLLLGESGTGKELAAHALHEMSRRAGGPLVALDCSGLTETLFESELFGHEKGAFTGADTRKQGLVEAAAGGTLFLDEIGDVPLHLQVKLLRLLETGTYRRVGGVETLSADFRLVTATHQDLAGMVERGQFRRDLYYRISVFPIILPPLRERGGDIALLAEALLAGIAPGRALRLTVEAQARIEAYVFPGNIRELRNVLERASLLCDGDAIRPEHLPPEIGGAAPSAGSAGLFDDIVPLHAAEWRYLQWAATRHRGDRKSLARLLGISERTLYRKLGG